MRKQMIRRRRYFVHPSSQLKYIAFSILPALIMTLFSVYFLNVSGELILGIQTETVLTELSVVEQTIVRVREAATKETADDVRRLNDVLYSFADAVLLPYLEAPQRWNEAKTVLFACLFSALMGTTILAVLYSHKIAGPLFRVKTIINMLSEGKDPQVIQFRKNDEFKELAEALEQLRLTLKRRGFWHPEE
jgi:nitrogen fixation/metabolism regulation signal transduction histidine kinase